MRKFKVIFSTFFFEVTVTSEEKTDSEIIEELLKENPEATVIQTKGITFLKKEQDNSIS